MDNIKKIIEREIKELTLDERNSFRGEVLTSLSRLVSDTSRRMDNFEKEVVASLGEDSEEVTIYSALLPSDEYYLYETIFSPVLKENLDILYDPIKGTEDTGKYLGEYYIEATTSQIKELVGKTFSCDIFMDGEIKNVKILVEESTSYMKEVEKLYSITRLNNVRWKTLNTPYFHKFVKLFYIKNEDDKIDEGTLSMDIVPEKINDFLVLKDYILSWNIKENFFLGDGVIKPTPDRIRKVHSVSFNSNKGTYLVPDKFNSIYHTYKEDESTVKIVTDEVKEVKWCFWTIKDPLSENLKQTKYPIFDNKINLNLLNRMRLAQGIRIRTLSEITRLINSFFWVKKSLSFVRYEVSIERKKVAKQLDLNDFIVDEFKLKGRLNYLYLYFTVLEDSLYIEDILSFIVSEIQLFFPEYKCLGVIL